MEERIRYKIETLLEECRRVLKRTPLSSYWIGKQTGLEQIKKELDDEYIK